MRKRGYALFLALTLVVGLCACGERETPPTPTATPTPLPTPSPKVERDTLEVYQELLTRLYEEHIDPDPELGQYTDEVWADLGLVEFAVCDVDMDGEQELILRHAHDIMAAQYTAVYRYDEEKEELVREVMGTASCRFYDNGMMQDDISHNQGWSGAFWPFTALRYDETAQEYRETVFVEALDREFMEANQILGYPEDADVDHAGFVYYIGEDGPVSQSVYDAWYAETFGAEILVNYLPLTVSNVGNLYYQGAVPPKVHVDVNNEWNNWELRGRRTARQEELLNDLPVEDLPRRAASRSTQAAWTREDIWEDTLLPLAYDEKNDVTLYAVVTEDSIPELEAGGYLSGAGVVLRWGDRTEYHAIEHEQFWTKANPLMIVRDLDNDGQDEVAVSLLSGHGTGVSVSILYIFDRERPWTYDTVDFSGVDIDVRYIEKDNKALLVSGEETLEIDVDDLTTEAFTGVGVGNVVRFQRVHGELVCVMGLDVNMRSLWYGGYAIAPVAWDGEKYTLGAVTLTQEDDFGRDDNADWEAELAACVVSGEETDYEAIAKELTRQYAAVVRARPQDINEAALDAQPTPLENRVYDAYYGEDMPNFCFTLSLCLDLEEERVTEWIVGTDLAEPGWNKTYPTYWGWAREAQAVKGEDGNWHLAGIATGGAFADLPVSISHAGDHPDLKELLDIWLLTEGETRDWRIFLFLDLRDYAVSEVKAELSKRSKRERKALEDGIKAYMKEYGGHYTWTAQDWA